MKSDMTNSTKEELCGRQKAAARKTIDAAKAERTELAESAQVRRYIQLGLIIDQLAADNHDARLYAKVLEARRAVIREWLEAWFGKLPDIRDNRAEAAELLEALDNAGLTITAQ